MPSLQALGRIRATSPARSMRVGGNHFVRRPLPTHRFAPTAAAKSASDAKSMCTNKMLIHIQQTRTNTLMITEKECRLLGAMFRSDECTKYVRRKIARHYCSVYTPSTRHRGTPPDVADPITGLCIVEFPVFMSRVRLTWRPAWADPYASAQTIPSRRGVSAVEASGSTFLPASQGASQPTGLAWIASISTPAPHTGTPAATTQTATATCEPHQRNQTTPNTPPHKQAIGNQNTHIKHSLEFHGHALIHSRSLNHDVGCCERSKASWRHLESTSLKIARH